MNYCNCPDCRTKDCPEGMTPEVKDTILAALAAYRGDTYERALRSFRGLTPAQMDAPYGRSGETCRQVLARYKAYADRVDAAAAWVRGEESR